MENLWYGKGVACQGCEQAFYWSHYLQLQSKEKGFHMSRGSAIHEAMQIASTLKKNNPVRDHQDILAEALLRINEKDEYRESMGEMKSVQMLQNAWDKISKLDVIDTETIIKMPHNGFEWLGLPDMIIWDPDGFWVGELKNTLAWGDRLRMLYYRDLQPWFYFTILEACYPQFSPMLGVKLVIATPPVIPRGQKEPRVIPTESIRITPQLRGYVQDFLTTTESKITEFHEKWDLNDLNRRKCYPRKDRTKCLTRQYECAYIMLCDAPEGSRYWQDAVDMLFIKQDPMSHYLDKEAPTYEG